MLQGWVVIVVALGYIGLLFAVARYGDKIRERGNPAAEFPHDTFFLLKKAVARDIAA